MFSRPCSRLRSSLFCLAPPQLLQTIPHRYPDIVHSAQRTTHLRQIRTIQMAAAASSERKKAPAIPRPSASMIVVNAKNEVLMVQRHSDSRSFAGAHVFPGGNFDKVQDTSIEMTAIRETFEETGILLASRAPDSKGSEISENAYDEARKAIHAGKLLFTDFLSENALVADTSSLLPFSTWITPPQAPRRFHAQFFVAFLPVASALSGPSSGTHTHRLPSPDSPNDDASTSTEVVSAQYVHPSAALSAFARGEIGLMPPQFYMLTTLRDLFGSGADADVNTPAQREQVQRLSHSVFGRMEFNPRYLSGAPRNSADGSQVLVLEGDETRGGKKGYLHRTIFTPQKGTLLPSKLNLIRNFDILTDLERTLSPASKL